MHKTKNDIAKTVRTRMIDLCNARLADALDLASQAKQAHWNVRGPQFAALHELFDKTAALFVEQADEIAERAAALGGIVEGTLRQAARKSALAEYPSGLVDGKEHVDALSSAIAAFAREARKAITEATKQDDAVTADLFTEIAGAADKQLWFVEAHLQGK